MELILLPNSQISIFSKLNLGAENYFTVGLEIKFKKKTNIIRIGPINSKNDRKVRALSIL